jgi:hypothetical protein
MQFISKLIRQPTLKEEARQQELVIRKATRENQAEHMRLLQAKEKIVREIDISLRTNDMSLAKSLSKHLVRINQHITKKVNDRVWLTECLHEVTSITEVTSKQEVVHGMVSLASKQNKNINIQKLIKQQKDATKAMVALRQGRDIMNETADDLVEDDNVEIDEDAEAQKILQQMQEKYALDSSSSMPSVPTHKPVVKSNPAESEHASNNNNNSNAHESINDKSKPQQ